VVWLGQFDLSLSLGVPGRFDDPTYLAAVDRLIEACRRHQRPLGQMIGTHADGAALRERGFQVLAYGDVLVFERAMREQMDALRGS
jgi:2-keto-3-deoxy-L-rhamnonate aldolase RhmA